jgi:hypothetical protein
VFALYILFKIMNGIIMLGGDRSIGGLVRYSVANELEWDEV